MNFKPAALKTISTLILGFLLGVIYNTFFHGLDYSGIGMNPWIHWNDILVESLLPII